MSSTAAWRPGAPTRNPRRRIELVGPDAVAPTILDVRQRNEYDAGHVPGSVHIELGSLNDAADQLPPGPVTVMCGHGERAMSGASILAAHGRGEVSVLRGGPAEWSDCDRPPARMTIREHDRSQPIRLGLRENLAQFSLLVAVNALVGGMIGQERTVLPLLATRTFHLTAFTATLTFIVAFGTVKAATNFFAGTLSDRFGRKPVLVAGWLIGLPVPLLIIWAPSWSWIVFANVLLGVNQGLTWSTTVIMKIDLVGPERRGLAMGFNEAAGYGAVALTALATGFIAQNAGLRPEPFFLGIAYAALGLTLSTLFVRETRDYAHLEARDHDANTDTPQMLPSTREVFALTTYREKALSSCSQAGLVNNLNDGLAWGLFPIYFADAGLSVGRIGVLAAVYPAIWGLGQLVTGALSDRIGRKWLIAGGMFVQAIAIGCDRGNHRVRTLDTRRDAARRRHRDGVSDAARRDRRRRPPALARTCGRRLPTLARRRLRRRRHPRRHPRRHVQRHRRDLGRRCAHRAFGPRGRRSHVRDAPAEPSRGPRSDHAEARRRELVIDDRPDVTFGPG